MNIKNKKKTKENKVGHCGTLDPFADGVILICTGKETKNINTFNVFKIVFHEWLALLNDLSLSKNFSTGINYWFRPPGWQPNILETKSP